MTDRQLLQEIAKRLAALEGAVRADTALTAAMERYGAGVPLTVRDVALVLGISVQGVRAAVDKGHLKKTGGAFLPANVAAYCVQRNQKRGFARNSGEGGGTKEPEDVVYTASSSGVSVQFPKEV